MVPLLLGGPGTRTRILAIGAHPDDIEIGCAGTLLKLIEKGEVSEVRWVVLSGEGERADEARRSAEVLLDGVPRTEVVVRDFPDGFFPYEGQRIKDFFEDLKADFAPDVVFTHQRADLHQDHRVTCELTWNTFRDHLILEYEVPKYDGDMSAPNAFVPLEDHLRRQKIDHLLEHFGSQTANAGSARSSSPACSACAAWSATRRVPTPRRSSAARRCWRDAGAARSERRPDSVGRDAFELMERLFPLCRSLTGSGVRATFDVLGDEIPIERTEIPSGTGIFDWIVPDEWNVRDAYILAPDGTRVVDLRDSNLHVVSYSEPVRTTLPLDQLRERLHTLPDQPDVIPYRTSYYSRTWGFCLSHNQMLGLEPGEYEVVIDSTLEPGRLSYAECEIEGAAARKCSYPPTHAIRRWRTTTCPGSRLRRCSRSNSSGDRFATPTASSSRRARSGRSHGCIKTATGSIAWRTVSRSTASVTMGHSPTSGAAAKAPRSTSPWRSSCATGALPIGCSHGSHGAATSASSARPASTCPWAR